MQLECVLHSVLAGVAFDAAAAERSLRPDDHGLVRRNGLPVADGCCFRCAPFADGRPVGSGCRSALFASSVSEVETVLESVKC